jgi:Ethanolamine utilization protein EutJ (predicted chaperonin)
MNIVMAVLTIVTFSICGPEKISIEENLEVKKNTNTQREKVIVYKKVPTKWVKITKKSN